MKKIILFLFFTICLGLNSSFAQEAMVMPTDAEIMQTIQKFNFDPAQQDYLFKETKRRLQEIYSSNGAMGNSQIMQVPDVTIENSSNETNNIQQSKQRKKKYTNHPPLTRRGAERAQRAQMK